MLFIIEYFSAGIGRTGVLILVETALCLIERNQPIFPLDIVRQMRDQRLGMIQTFVCTEYSIRSALKFLSFRLNINSLVKPFSMHMIKN